FPKTRTEITGTPVRTELVPLDHADARRKLGLQEDLPTLLVMGGSQGASGINQALIKALPFLQDVPLQVIHLSGARMNAWLRIIIVAKMSLLTSRRFIIAWKKFTVPPISLLLAQAPPAWLSLPRFRCPAF